MFVPLGELCLDFSQCTVTDEGIFGRFSFSGTVLLFFLQHIVEVFLLGVVTPKQDRFILVVGCIGPRKKPFGIHNRAIPCSGVVCSDMTFADGNAGVARHSASAFLVAQIFFLWMPACAGSLIWLWWPA